MYSDCLHPVQGPLKIRNQLAIEPEIFSEVMTNLEKTTYFWAEFRSFLSSDIDIMMSWWGIFFHISNRLDH
jgi:hypothetical protein